MITANFKKALAVLLLSRGSNNVPGYVAVKDTTNTTMFLSFRTQFPGSVDGGVKIQSTANPGIWLGRGSTPETENDYALETRITTGLTASTPTATTNKDTNGCPYLQYLFTVTNTTATDITINEIGYVQNFHAANSDGASANNYVALLIDRTVLSAPLTVPAGESAVIRYTLKAVI